MSLDLSKNSVSTTNSPELFAKLTSELIRPFILEVTFLIPLLQLTQVIPDIFNLMFSFFIFILCQRYFLKQSLINF